MMGPTHAMTGTLAFGCASLAWAYDLVPFSPGLSDWIIGPILFTAGALFPDIDHHKATVTKTFGGLTRLVRWLLIKPLFGKHREGTHSIFFAALVGFGSWLMIEHLDLLGCKIGLWVLLSIVTSSLIRLFKIKGWKDDVAPLPLWAGVIFLTDIDLKIVPWALAIGCLTHLIGDCMTDRGCPILWPISKDKITLGLYSTGKGGEGVAQWITFIGWLAVVAAHVAHAAGLM